MSGKEGTSSKTESFNDFYTEVKQIEKRDSVLTSKQQIERLLRPGSTYFNLNPFEVLQLEMTHHWTKSRKNTNPDDRDRAQTAFEAVNRAWKVLENDVTRKRCLEMYEEAKERTDHMIAEKRKKLKKEGKTNEKIEEDDPEKYKHSCYVLVMKLFADMERKRQSLEQRDMEERKRKREAEIDEEEKRKNAKEWQKNFEESRQSRVDSWHTFQSGGAKKKKKEKKNKAGMFVPPKLKPESR
uniref:J domain-containing protein n=1 Tax=Megaselia scalaris TaxID=36166 RepID=T1GDC0_MEGSC